MKKLSPWSNPPPELDSPTWIMARDLEAIQLRIDNLEVPEQHQPLGPFKTKVVNSEEELMNFLTEILK
jgi:hypothetical protein